MTFPVEGTATNDNAALGMVGEFISAQLGVPQAVPLTSGVAANVLQIYLTPGDWGIWGNIGFTPGATTNVTMISGAVDTLSGVVPGVQSGATVKQFGAAGLVPVGTFTIIAGKQRLSIAIPTTVYLTVAANFTVSTLGAFGFINAQRRR